MFFFFKKVDIVELGFFCWCFERLWKEKVEERWGGVFLLYSLIKVSSFFPLSAAGSGRG